MKIQNFILILLAFSLLSCTSANVKRGPFELSIETKDQKQVEDVIVRLSNRVTLLGPWERGSTTIYDETRIISTNVAVTFPKGRVKDSDTVSMWFRAYHPCFTAESYNATFDATNKGKVDFGIRLLVEDNVPKLRKYTIQHTPWLTDYKKPSLVHANWQHYFEPPWAIHQYFGLAVKVDRMDLVEKYLPLMLSYYLKDAVLDEKPKKNIFSRMCKNNRSSGNCAQEYDLVRRTIMEGKKGPAFTQLYNFYLNQIKHEADNSKVSKLIGWGHNDFFQFAFDMDRIDLIGKYLELIFQSRIKGEEYCSNFYPIEEIN